MLKEIKHILLLAAAYFASGYLGLQLPVYGTQITLFWPPTGIAVAALLRWGPRVWPGIAIGAVGVNCLMGNSLLLALEISIGNTLGPLAAWWLCRRAKIAPDLQERRDIFSFFCLGAAVPMVITASGGCFALWLSGALPVDKLAYAWESWWWGDMLGVLLFTPALLVYRREKWHWRCLIETRNRDVLWALSLFVVSSVLVLFQPFSIHLPPQMVGLPALALVWFAALRGLWETSIATVLLGFIAILGAALGHGPFISADKQSTLFWLWMFISSLTMVGLFVSAMSAEYRLSLERLKASEKRLTEAQRITQMGSWELDILTGDLKWSDEIFRIFEIDPERFPASYEAFLAAIHPGDREVVDKAYLDSLNDRLPYSIVHRLQMPDGRIKYVHEQCESFFDAEGKPVRSLGTIQDITERKLAQLALDESRSLLSLVIDSVPLGIYWKDKNLRYLGCNSLFVRDAGKATALEVIGKTDLELGWKDQSEHYEAEDREVLDSGLAKLNFEQTVLTATGENVILRASKIALRNEGQAIIGLLGVYDDITLRKQQEQELLQYRQHLEDLVAKRTEELEVSNRRLSETEFAMDSCDIGIYWLDADSARFNYVNAPACAMLGYTEQEMLGMRLTEVLPLLGGTDVASVTGFLLSQGNTRFETVNKAKQGRIIPVEMVCFYRPPEQGFSGHFIAFVTDISQRKIAEKALIEAKSAAESANRAKSIFLANMSHELRTPLNVMLGFAQLMERDAQLTEHHKMELQTIKSSGRHLLALINDVLEISRIEAGGLTLQNEVFDLHETIAVVREMIFGRAESKGLDFSVEYRGGLPKFVSGDDHHLRQVLINLLSNAVKYTDRGQVLLRLTPTEGRQILFEVCDTGVGIAEADKGKLFQAFFQTENGITKGEGTGLGLSICREFVQLMGGELTVSSAPGRGSTFAFSLCLPESPAPAFTQTEPGQVLGLAAGQPACRVLVVEDHADNRELLKRLLQSAGFEVQAVNDGQQAVAAFEQWRPDFIWMDMRMPVMDGYTATKLIRALPGGREVKIAAITASAFTEDRQAILAAGCDELLTKPLEQNALFEIMRKLLNLNYRYEEAVSKPEQASTIRLDLHALNAAQGAELKQAAGQLDVAAVQAFIAGIELSHPDIAAALKALLKDFRFEQILHALEQAQ